MDTKDFKIAVAGTGYVGLSIATLLSQHHQVTAVDVIPEKVDMLNRKQSASSVYILLSFSARNGKYVASKAMAKCADSAFEINSNSIALF